MLYSLKNKKKFKKSKISLSKDRQFLVIFSATGSGSGHAIWPIVDPDPQSAKSRIQNTLRGGGGKYNVVSCCCCYLASSPALSCILPTLSPVGSWKFTATVSIHELSVFLTEKKIKFISRIRRRIKSCVSVGDRWNFGTIRIRLLLNYPILRCCGSRIRDSVLFRPLDTGCKKSRARIRDPGWKSRYPIFEKLVSVFCVKNT